MKIIILILTALSLSTAFAKECTYTVKKENVTVSWTAFKTPAKVGVGGKFTSLGIENEQKGKSLKSLLKGVKFNIDPSSTSTNDKARDAKIVKFFFDKMKGKKIQGEVVSYAKGFVTLSITMNGVTKTVPLKMKVEKNMATANGHIDILDFMMSDSLSSLNEACNELHLGKTWSHVELTLTFSYNKTC